MKFNFLILILAGFAMNTPSSFADPVKVIYQVNSSDAGHTQTPVAPENRDCADRTFNALNQILGEDGFTSEPGYTIEVEVVTGLPKPADKGTPVMGHSFISKGIKLQVNCSNPKLTTQEALNTSVRWEIGNDAG